MSVSWQRLLGLMIASSWLAAGCSSAKKIDVGGACLLNSDCTQGLVCSWGKCHYPCHTTADCPIGQSCVKSDLGLVCQLPVDNLVDSQLTPPDASPTDVGADLVTAPADAGMSEVDATPALVDAFETPAKLVAAPLTLSLDTVTVGQSSKEGSIMIGNVGQQVSGIVTLSSDNAEFEIQSAVPGDCISGTTLLLPGTACAVRVTLVPAAMGARTGSLAFLATPGGSGTVKLDGAGSCAADTVPDAQGHCVTMAGAVWTQRGTVQDWSSVASSSDGTKLVAVAGPSVYNSTGAGNIYISSDSGVTWTPSGPSQTWSSVASSSDGTKLVAVVGRAMNYGSVYTSGDSGATWTRTGITQAWISVASSSDGTKLVAVSYGSDSYVFTSGDSGVTWTPTGPMQSWSSVASSADGTKLVAGGGPGYLYTSGDSGATWTQTGPSQPWYSVASSSDGTRLAATFSTLLGGGYIYTSADSGATWTRQGTRQTWTSVASSSDGTKLVAAGWGDYIYTSWDSGATWTEKGTRQDWSSVASSSDGTKLVAVVNGGYIYTSSGPVP